MFSICAKQRAIPSISASDSSKFQFYICSGRFGRFLCLFFMARIQFFSPPPQLQPLDNNSRMALLQILDDCYQRKSVIVTSQLPVSNINEPTSADAIMDRLTANAVRIELKVDSIRRKNQKK